MKIQATTARRQSGSVILMCLMISALIGLTLASYLVLTQSQMVSVARSQTWNTTITLSEAGIEDGLQLINKYSGIWGQLTNWPTTAAADNWTFISPNVYHVRRYVGSDYYDAYVTNVNNMPTVTSIASIAWNYLYASTAPPLYADVGGAASAATATTRKVLVRTRVDPLFSAAMAAIYTIDLKGTDVKTDSFDSADQAYSNNGIYEPTKNKANGDVVTDDTIVNSVSVGNANIRGRVRTGPSGTVYVGPRGVVGDLAYTADPANYGTIKDGWSSDDMNVSWPDVVLPNKVWSQLWPGVTINGFKYDNSMLISGNYTAASSAYSGSIYVASNVVATLYLPGGASLSGQQVITISQGASLTIYTAGSFSTSGLAALNNLNQNAANFSLFGLPSCTSISINGNAAVTGVIYAPEAMLSIGGGGTTVYDFVGASVSQSVVMNGHMNFHYDENLQRVGPGRGYIPVSWAETKVY